LKRTFLSMITFFRIKSENGLSAQVIKRLKALVLVLVIIILCIVIGIGTKKVTAKTPQSPKKLNIPTFAGIARNDVANIARTDVAGTARTDVVALAKTDLESTDVTALAKTDLHSTDVASFQRPTEIVWLHIPKCGTSFLNTLYHYACPGIPEDAEVGTKTDPEHQEFDLTKKYPMDESWDTICTMRFEMFNVYVRAHDPIYDDTKLENVFTMFRDPFDRLVSGFNYHRHMDGKEKWIRQLIGKAVKGKSREIQFKMYTEFGDLLGCQTKMIVGYHCASNHVLTKADLQKAKERVEKFGFIGITGEWNRSICLFHKQFGGQIYDVEYQNNREQHYTKDEFTRINDKNDDELYKHVNTIVHRRFLKFGC